MRRGVSFYFFDCLQGECFLASNVWTASLLHFPEKIVICCPGIYIFYLHMTSWVRRTRCISGFLQWAVPSYSTIWKKEQSIFVRTFWCSFLVQNSRVLHSPLKTLLCNTRKLLMNLFGVNKKWGHNCKAEEHAFKKVTDSKVSNYVRLFGSVYSDFPPFQFKKVKFYAN